MRIAVFGGTGFVGRALCHRLSSEGAELRLFCRNPQRHRDLLLLPGLTLGAIDLSDEEAINRACADSDLSCNLIGVLHDRRRGGFRDLHINFPRRLAQACRRADIPLVHVSALGAAPTAPSKYLRSKAMGEKMVSGELKRAVIFRPGIIYGPQDHFLAQFAALVRTLPVIAVPCPHARLVPVYIEDVTAAIAGVCMSRDGPTFSADESRDLVGPDSYRLIELVRLIAGTLGLRRLVLPLDPLSSLLGAAVLGMLPGRLFTLDNRRSLRADSSSEAAPCPTKITEVLADCLSPANPQQRLQRYRREQGR